MDSGMYLYTFLLVGTCIVFGAVFMPQLSSLGRH